MRFLPLFILAIAANVSAATFADRTFTSGNKPVQLVELYTSEGCSSCPSADRWLSRLKAQDKLWSGIVPVAFHVDYWNYLGWEDEFSSAAHSRRQRDYQRNGNINSVYTPGFVVDGLEWRGWFKRRALPESAAEPAGVLTLVLEQGVLRGEYKPAENDRPPKTLTLNVALLGFDIHTDIKAGENRGKRLKHDFVVLNHQRSRSSDNTWSITLPQNIQPMPKGLAAWIVDKKSKRPLQATGGWL